MVIDDRTLAEFKEGKIDRLYLKIYPSLVCYAERALGDRNSFLAEDCVQNAIYKVYDRRKTFASALDMRSYIFSCVHNEVVNVYRKSMLNEQFIRGSATIEDRLLDEYIVQETLDKIGRVVATMSDPQQELFRLLFVEGMKNVEVAELLAVSPETIKKRKAKLIAQLRDYFKGDAMASLAVTFLLFSSMEP